MTNLLVEGFEWMGTAGQHNARTYIFTTGGGAPTTGRLFGQAMAATSMVFDTRSFGLRTTLVMGWGFRLTAAPGTNKHMAFTKGGVEQFRWEYVDNAGTGFNLVFKRGATTLGTSPLFAYGIWHYFEVKATIDIGVAGSIELRRNEIPQLTLSALNSANEGTAGADAFRYTWSATTGNPNWDDWYINDTLGADNNDFLGDVGIEGFTVTAEGATIDWTPSTGTNNAAMLDEGNAVLDDFNSSDTVGQKDLHVCSDLVFTTGTIFAVQIEVELAMATAGSRNVGARYRTSGGTEAAGGVFAVSSTTYQNFRHIFERNPVTAAVWVNADIDGGQLGYEVLV